MCKAVGRGGVVVERGGDWKLQQHKIGGKNVLDGGGISGKIS